MSRRPVSFGAISVAVAQNIRRIRTEQNLQYKQVSDRLASHGRHIPALSIRRIECAERQVTVDDLVALATALGASVLELLTPTPPALPATPAVDPVEVYARQRRLANSYAARNLTTKETS